MGKKQKSFWKEACAFWLVVMFVTRYLPPERCEEHGELLKWQIMPIIYGYEWSQSADRGPHPNAHEIELVPPTSSANKPKSNWIRYYGHCRYNAGEIQDSVSNA